MKTVNVIEVAQDAVAMALLIAAPILIVGLVVALLVGLFQALTQIQEATLIYAPKILAIFLALLVFLPLMGALMAGFMHQIASRIAGM